MKGETNLANKFSHNGVRNQHFHGNGGGGMLVEAKLVSFLNDHRRQEKRRKKEKKKKDNWIGLQKAKL